MEAVDPRIGVVLDGRYRIVSRVATGSMGVIYRGERLKLGRSVAIKVLHTPLANQERFIQRFEVEARALSRLGHPNCVSIIDFGVADAPYLVMEFIPGRTLKQLIDQQPLSASRVLHIFRQLLAGLAHAHGHGIVHRDVKPGNVMLTEATGTGDHIRILDFGLAKLHNAALAEDDTGSAKVIGTPAYMSPEQARGREGDARSDIYSAGVMLFEMLTGQKPFDAEEMLEVLEMQAEQAPPLLRSAAQGQKFSEELEALVHRALAKKPEDRYQTALELAAALDQTPEAAQPLHRFYGQTKKPTEGTAELRLGRPSRRRWWVLVVVLCVLGAGGVWFYLRREPGVDPPPAATLPVARPLASPTGDMGGERTPAPDATARGAGEPRSSAERSAQDMTVPDTRAVSDTQSAVDAQSAVDEESETEERLPGSGLARAHALIRASRWDEAITELRKLRQQTRSPYVDYLLGRVYFQRHWWSEGMKHYQAAIRGNPRNKSHAALIRDVTSALIDRRTAPLAEKILVQEIGRPARAHLSHVARHHPVAAMRIKAGRLLTRIR